MAYQNKHDKTGQNSTDGERAETLFRDLAVGRDFMVIEATKTQQYSHIDFLIEKNGKIWEIDVKSKKKLSRQDSDYCFEWLWVEIQSVRGEPGWIYSKGWLALEMEDHFILVAKKDLAALVEKLVDFNSTVDKSSKAKYKLYRRFNRRDKISLVESKHLYELEHLIWKKQTTQPKH